MADDSEEYRPRSPDIDNDAKEPVHPQHREYRGSISHAPPYTPITPVGNQADYYFGRQASIGQPVWSQPQYNPEQSPQLFQPQYQPQYHPVPTLSSPQPPMPRTLAAKDEMKTESGEEFIPVKKGRGRPPGSKKEKLVKDESQEDEMMMDAPSYDGPEIRTKFPVARIKRIMQADEDVGKVAQVTPLAVSRALELFMTALITKSAEEARTRGSKRVSTAHLKQVIKSNEQFDFLGDLVEKIPDAPPPSAKKGFGGDSEDEGKRKKPGRRRKADAMD